MAIYNADHRFIPAVPLCSADQYFSRINKDIIIIIIFIIIIIIIIIIIVIIIITNLPSGYERFVFCVAIVFVKPRQLYAYSVSYVCLIIIMHSYPLRHARYQSNVPFLVNFF